MDPWQKKGYAVKDSTAIMTSFPLKNRKPIQTAAHYEIL
jgi:hypothetical protein